MKRRYMDAMTLVQKYGKPNFFLTVTCNPHWEEIIRELEPGQTAQDRPDISRPRPRLVARCKDFEKASFYI